MPKLTNKEYELVINQLAERAVYAQRGTIKAILRNRMPKHKLEKAEWGKGERVSGREIEVCIEVTITQCIGDALLELEKLRDNQRKMKRVPA